VDGGGNLIEKNWIETPNRWTFLIQRELPAGIADSAWKSRLEAKR